MRPMHCVSQYVANRKVLSERLKVSQKSVSSFRYACRKTASHSAGECSSASSRYSEERQVVHGQLNAIDDGQPPTRSADTSPTDTSVPFHADTCKRSCIT